MNVDLAHDSDFYQFEGFSCYYNPLALPKELSDGEFNSEIAVAHEHVEVVVLLGSTEAETVVGKITRNIAPDDCEVALTPGQICIIPQQQPHWLQLHQPSALMLISLTPQLIVEATHKTLRTPRWQLPERYGIKDETILFLADALRFRLGQKSAISNLYRQSLINLLAVHLMTQYAEADFKQDKSTNVVASTKLLPIIAHINDNLDRPLKVSSLAALAELSQSHFCRVFKEAVGLSPYQYVLSERIAKAQTLLGQTNLSLAEISFQCGFYDQSHFILQFRRFTGSTPKKYREDRTRPI